MLVVEGKDYIDHQEGEDKELEVEEVEVLSDNL